MGDTATIYTLRHNASHLTQPYLITMFCGKSSSLLSASLSQSKY